MVYSGLRFLLHDHFTGCPLEEFWILSSSNLTDVGSLNNSTAQYPSCDGRSIGSIALVNTTLNTATVAYYTGTTPGSTACFVCDSGSGYEPNIAVTKRVCQSDGIWSGSRIICGMLNMLQLVDEYIKICA